MTEQLKDVDQRPPSLDSGFSSCLLQQLLLHAMKRGGRFPCYTSRPFSPFTSPTEREQAATTARVAHGGGKEGRMAAPTEKRCRDQSEAWSVAAPERLLSLERSSAGRSHDTRTGAHPAILPYAGAAQDFRRRWQ